MDLLVKSQNSTIWLILDMSWSERNFHMHKKVEQPCRNDFIELVKFSLHLIFQYCELIFMLQL